MLTRISIAIPALVALSILAGCGRTFKLPHDSVASESSWAFPRRTVEGTGAINSGYSGRLDVIWENGSNDKPAGPLTLVHGYLVYPGTKGKIKFYGAKSGNYSGRLKFKGVPQTGLMSGGRLGFVGLGYPRNKVEGINLRTSKKVWEQALKDITGGSIIVNDHLIVGSTDGTVLAIDTASGRTLWNRKLSGRLTAPPVSGEGVIVQPTDNGKLIGISPDDGSERFAAVLAAPLIASAVVDKKIFAADFYGRIHCVDASSGRVLWFVTGPGPVWSPPAVAGDRLLVTYGQGTLAALSVEDGHTLWKYDSREITVASPTVVGDVVVVGTKKGQVYTVRLDTGTLIDSRRIKGAISVAAVSDGSRVYMATDKGLIICFGDKDATQREHSENLDTKHQP